MRREGEREGGEREGEREGGNGCVATCPCHSVTPPLPSLPPLPPCSLHRLAVFRDDIIFLIYLYQKWIYPVDKKRKNEFGSSAEDLANMQAWKEGKVRASRRSKLERLGPEDQALPPIPAVAAGMQRPQLQDAAREATAVVAGTAAGAAAAGRQQ